MHFTRHGVAKILVAIYEHKQFSLYFLYRRLSKNAFSTLFVANLNICMPFNSVVAGMYIHCSGDSRRTNLRVYM